MPTLVLLGDDDEVRFEHALATDSSLRDGELCVIPRATHGVIVEKPEPVVLVIRNFHSTSKANGFAPIRRVS